MPKKIKALVVDDSAFIRKALKRILNSDPMIKVVGDARDGPEAIELVKTLTPDVITLDVNMPGMDGIIVLKRIMAENPTPALMVSSLTNEGGGATLNALEAGAVDFIDKSSCHAIMDIMDIADDLIKKVKIIAGVDMTKVVEAKTKVRERKQVAPPPSKDRVDRAPEKNVPSHIVVIGASTGGPMSVERVLTNIPGDYPGAIMVVQHMPVGFTQSFAERLDTICKMKVQEANEDSVILPGNIYIAPGGCHMKMRKVFDQYKIRVSKNPRDAQHCPSIDVMMLSVAEIWPGKSMGVILTGMGDDGTEGALEMKKKGAYIVSQDENTCVVYGMPRAVYLSGCVDKVVPLQNVPDEIVKFNV